MYLNYGFEDSDESASLFARQYRTSRRRRLATGAIVGIAIACAIFILACLLCCYFCCLRKRRSKRAGAHAHAQPVQHSGGGGGFLSNMMPGRKNQHNQPAYGPGMQQAGYGAGYGGQQPMYGGQHNGVQPPPPTYR